MPPLCPCFVPIAPRDLAQRVCRTQKAGLFASPTRFWVEDRASRRLVKRPLARLASAAWRALGVARGRRRERRRMLADGQKMSRPSRDKIRVSTVECTGGIGYAWQCLGRAPSRVRLYLPMRMPGRITCTGFCRTDDVTTVHGFGILDGYTRRVGAVARRRCLPRYRPHSIRGSSGSHEPGSHKSGSHEQNEPRGSATLPSAGCRSRPGSLPRAAVCQQARGGCLGERCHVFGTRLRRRCAGEQRLSRGSLRRSGGLQRLSCRRCPSHASAQ